ncbi:MAG: hypothetical protein U0840_25580 [Gemmataceae bacterium]
MRIGTCSCCGRREIWVNVFTRSGNEYCATCWRDLELPEDTGLPAIRRVKTSSEEPNPWGETAVRAMEDAAAVMEEVS